MKRRTKTLSLFKVQGINGSAPGWHKSKKGWSKVATLLIGVVWARQERTPGAVHSRGVDVLVRAVNDREVTLGAFDMDCGCMKRPARVAACSRGGVENGSVKTDIPASRCLLR